MKKQISDLLEILSENEMHEIQHHREFLDTMILNHVDNLTVDEYYKFRTLELLSERNTVLEEIRNKLYGWDL